MWTLLAAGLLCGVANTAASALEITAEFKPSLFRPNDRQFVNTSAASGFCLKYPDECAAAEGKVFSIDFPIYRSYGALKANETNPRMAAYVKVPSSFRNVEVVNSATGQRSKLRFRVSGLTMGYESTTAWKLVGGVEADWSSAHIKLWGRGWAGPEAPCTRLTKWGYVSTSWMLAIWGFPEGAGGCAKIPAYAISAGLPGFSGNEGAGMMYELQTPDPFAMGNGEYKGSLDFKVGPGQDFDFGDNATVSASTLKINFTLKVQHELKVLYPEAGRRVLLEPAGGWQVWMQQGRPPAALRRDVPFTIASSGNFAIRLQCQYEDGVKDQGCSIANAVGSKVPLAVAVSMQGIRRLDGGGNAERVLLNRSSGGVRFTSRFLSSERRSRLHFSVAAPDVAKMVKRAGDKYQGTVTVIFDAAVN